ncbi:hypothetical protein FOVG_16572 [Fusarium oxysporum f. sp. pisi HDV247]|uniref:Uncharacterized protein n=1 Tax=Fusarium oxysporum f. sp. pisi HDV247 TaxID=1080344 RepID=W9NN79_FUSOX|nr:hypothetical protein FOVG_16572 [Fusarium oxysporum f. sp. pisi HDV247]
MLWNPFPLPSEIKQDNVSTSPRRRGRPRKAESEEARIARERALQRVRSQRYYERKHQQAVQPSLPPAELHQTEFVHYHHALSQQSPAASSTDPSTGFHLESQLHIPIPDEDPLPVESTLIDHEPSGVEVDSAEGLWRMMIHIRVIQRPSLAKF